VCQAGCRSDHFRNTCDQHGIYEGHKFCGPDRLAHASKCPDRSCSCLLPVEVGSILLPPGTGNCGSANRTAHVDTHWCGCCRLDVGLCILVHCDRPFPSYRRISLPFSWMDMGSYRCNSNSAVGRAILDCIALADALVFRPGSGNLSNPAGLVVDYVWTWPACLADARSSIGNHPLKTNRTIPEPLSTGS